MGGARPASFQAGAPGSDGGCDNKSVGARALAHAQAQLERMFSHQIEPWEHVAPAGLYLLTSGY
eukprot:1606054-Alexandrium_andersonii.AAC.1